MQNFEPHPHLILVTVNVSILLAVSASRGATISSWEVDGAMLEPSGQHAAMSSGDKIFVFGGHGNTGASHLGTAYLYQPGGTIIPMPPLPEPRSDLGYTFHKGRAYALGGLAGPRQEEVWSIDPLNDTSWFTETPLPSRRDELGSASLGDYIYAVGGSTGGFNGGLNFFQRLDPDTATEWETLESLSVNRRRPGVAAVGGKLYIIGGFVATSSLVNHGTMEIFDPLAGTLMPGPDLMPTPRNGFATVVIGSRIYTFGGEASTEISNAVEYYDTSLGQWFEDTPLPVAVQGPGAAVIDNKIYVLGGFGEGGLPDTKDTVYVSSVVIESGDFNGDKIVDNLDIDLLRTAVIANSSDANFNIDGLGDLNVPDEADFDFLISNIIRTEPADGDLNKIINLTDFQLIANNFTSTGTGWAQGNFNLDDITNFDDFVILANRFTGVIPPAQLTSVWSSSDNVWSDSAGWSTVPRFPNNRIDYVFDVVVNGGVVTLDVDVAIQQLILNGGMLTNDVTGAVIEARVIAKAGSTIRASGGDLALGNGNALNGFYCNCNLELDGNTVVLNDTNDAVFDSAALVTVGSKGNPGTLVANNGLTLDFGANITGVGAVDTPDELAKPLINNGHISGISAFQQIELTGWIRGFGTLDNVIITGTDDPGFSPAKVSRGSVSYNGTVRIELGGTDPGFGHDQINHIQGDGLAGLGGTLAISLINNFTPDYNDSFTIMTFSSSSGRFDEYNGVFVNSAMTLLPIKGESDLTLIAALPGDGDLNGVVNFADFALIANNFNGSDTEWGQGNFDLNHTTNFADFVILANNFGSMVPADNTVPEPATLMLLIGVVLTLRTRRA